MKKLYNHDSDNACYCGYILKSLADAKRNLGDIRRYNLFTDFMDEESRKRLAEVYHVLDSMLAQYMDEAGKFGAIISPNQELSWNDIEKYSKIGKKTE